MPTPPTRDLSFVRSLGGKFIVFDGPDGSGKTTQFIRAVQFCRDSGLRVCEVREPGGTVIGEAVREILLHHKDDAEPMSLRCEMLLYMASRAQLVERTIRPALQRGDLVLADRFVSSTLAYQGSAGGIPQRDIENVADVACGEVRPDLVVIFDVDEKTAEARMSRTLDRMESKGNEFRRKVRQGYLDQAKADPARHIVIDASQEEAKVTAGLIAGLREWTGKAAAEGR